MKLIHPIAALIGAPRADRVPLSPAGEMARCGERPEERAGDRPLLGKMSERDARA
jgi:hypothetical protein